MRVLVVDDNSLTLEIISEMLLSMSEVSEISTNIDTVVEFNPDLIILDLYMPTISGYELCIKYKSNPFLSDIPIIMLSSSHNIEDKIKCFSAGALDYIEKPIPRELLISTVKKYASIGEIYKAGRNINPNII